MILASNLEADDRDDKKRVEGAAPRRLKTLPRFAAMSSPRPAARPADVVTAIEPPEARSQRPKPKGSVGAAPGA